MNEAQLELLHRDRAALLDALRQAGADASKPNAIRCPFHEDRHASAGVYADGAGVWRFKCNAAGCGFGGDVVDVLARISNRTPAEQLRAMNAEATSPPARHSAPAKGTEERPAKTWATLEAMLADFSTIDRVHRYTDPDTGALELVVVRYLRDGAKRFAQCHSGDLGWVMKAPPGLLPIYNRTRVRAAECVVFVEGEKCVEALAKIGIVATTTPGGAGKGHLADLRGLAGKEVVLWPDNDAADRKTGARTGIVHMREIAKLLCTLQPAPRLRWIDPDTLRLADKGDAADLIEQFGDDREAARATVEQIMREAEPLGPAAELRALLNDTIAGRRVAIAWPFSTVDFLTRALLPGTVTLLCGSPGAAKSFALLQCVDHWTAAGVRTAVLMLEESRAFHLSRALAQAAGESRLTDPAWVVHNGGFVMDAERKHRNTIERIGAAIHTPPDAELLTLDAVADWVRVQCEAGSRVVAVDPVTIASRSREPWIDDGRFMAAIKRAVEQHEASVVLVTHPRVGGMKRGGPILDEVAGGASYSRFAATALWIVHYIPPKSMIVVEHTAHGTLRREVQTDRAILIAKSRNGRGKGAQVAVKFDPDTLRFKELGIVVRSGETEEA